jgi:two-component system sensor histidine kinase KdpD
MELDRTRSALLAAVGHDLRTPLSGIKAAVSSLRQTDVAWTEQEQADLLATIELSTDRLTALVANLLDATRIEAGAVVAAPEAIALDEVVYSSLSAFPNAGVDVSLPISLPMVTADPVLLERVLVNLIDNAVRFGTPGTKVELRGRTAEAGIELAVIDHAVGASTKVTDRFFMPFQRTTDRESSGIGLGLFIVKGFCDAMGIRIEPQPTEGGGWTMTLTLAAAI